MNDYKFKGVFISAELWQDENLTPSEKFLIAEIGAMSDGIESPCFASNSHFATHLKVTVGTIRNMISRLRELGYIHATYVNEKLHSGRKMCVMSPSDTRNDMITPPSSNNDTPSSNNDTINKPLNTLLNTPSKNQDKKENIIEACVVDDFDLFWSEYPKKVDKAKAKTAYKKVSVGIDVVLSALRLHKQSDQWVKDNGQFIPNPTTWINNARWEDELQPSATRQKLSAEVEQAIVIMRQRGYNDSRIAVELQETFGIAV